MEDLTSFSHNRNPGALGGAVTPAITERRKKILFVITKSNWGGAQRYVYNLATTLPKDQFEVVVAFGGTGAAHTSPGELHAKLAAAGIRTIEVPTFARNVSFGNDIKSLGILHDIFKAERPDVVHLNSSKAGGVGALAARLAGIPNIIFTSHGLVWDEDRNPLSTFLIYIFSQLTFLLCHRIILISKDNYARARGLFGGEKYVFIPNGLPILEFESRERAQTELQLRAGLHVEDTASFWIGTIAELTANKGLTYLIDAAKLLAEQGKNFQLCIIGGGEEEKVLKAHAARLGLQKQIHFLGFVSDASRFMKGFDCFVLSSVKEGLPTVLLEAGQAQIPVVATNIPGARDIIDDAVSGLLTKVKNPKDMAQKITTLIDTPHLCTSLAQQLHTKVTSTFSLEKMVHETAKLY